MTVKTVWVHVTGPKLDPMAVQFEQMKNPKWVQQHQDQLIRRAEDEMDELSQLLSQGYIVLVSHVIEASEGQAICLLVY